MKNPTTRTTTATTAATIAMERRRRTNRYNLARVPGGKNGSTTTTLNEKIASSETNPFNMDSTSSAWMLFAVKILLVLLILFMLPRLATT